MSNYVFYSEIIKPHFLSDGRKCGLLHFLSVCSLAVLLAAICFPQTLSAQKKQLNEARDYVKSGKNLDKAEQILTKLLADSVNRENPRVYATLYEAIYRQLNQANERLYLQQKQDTSAFFSLTSRLFDTAFSLDSLDARPGKNGRSKPVYRSSNSSQLERLRPNLFAGGSYHVRRGKYSEAYSFFEKYITSATQPLFIAQNFTVSDKRLPEAAYYATLCGAHLKDAILTLRHSRLAMSDTLHLSYTMRYVAEAWKSLNDDSLYVSTLRSGFEHFPLNTYFFSLLIDHYNSHGELKKSLALTDEALAVSGTLQLFRFAKSTVLLNLGRYDESIAISERLIADGDTLPEIYYNAGIAYVNKASALDPLTQKKALRKYYVSARGYLEKYRFLRPEEQAKWAPALYRVYLNLNMGKQFDEIDRLMKAG